MLINPPLAGKTVGRHYIRFSRPSARAMQPAFPSLL
jgi:hypothetical protein